MIKAFCFQCHKTVNEKTCLKRSVNGVLTEVYCNDNCFTNHVIEWSDKRNKFEFKIKQECRLATIKEVTKIINNRIEKIKKYEIYPKDSLIYSIDNLEFIKELLGASK